MSRKKGLSELVMLSFKVPKHTKQQFLLRHADGERSKILKGLLTMFLEGKIAASALKN